MASREVAAKEHLQRALVAAHDLAQVAIEPLQQRAGGPKVRHRRVVQFLHSYNYRKPAAARSASIGAMHGNNGATTGPSRALRERVGRAVRPLDDAGEPVFSDYDLNPGAARPRAPALSPAAVLLPIVEHIAGPTVLFTKRTAHLNAHAGQVSFPGGRLEPEDAGPVAAALRETHEETGIGPDFVQPIGLLDDYETVTRFRVTPVVGFVRPGFTLVPDPFEVESVFEVPLAFLMDSRNREIATRMRDGLERRYFRFRHGGFEIWGATAGMLVSFLKRLEG